MLSADARRISTATGRWQVCREVRHTAASPISQIMYWGLMTRLVTVNSSTALSAASYGVASLQRRARTRHSTSSPKETAVSASEAVATACTWGPVISIAPYW